MCSPDDGPGALRCSPRCADHGDLPLRDTEGCTSRPREETLADSTSSDRSEEAPLKPALTFARAARQLRRWWPLGLLSALVGALAEAGAGLVPTTFRGEPRVTAQDTTTSYSGLGAPQRYTPFRSVNDASRTDFVTLPAAEKAVE